MTIAIGNERLDDNNYLIIKNERRNDLCSDFAVFLSRISVWLGRHIFHPVHSGVFIHSGPTLITWQHSSNTAATQRQHSGNTAATQRM